MTALLHRQKKPECTGKLHSHYQLLIGAGENSSCFSAFALRLVFCTPNMKKVPMKTILTGMAAPKAESKPK